MISCENSQSFVALCFNLGRLRLFHDYRPAGKLGLDCISLPLLTALEDMIDTDEGRED